MTKLSEAKPKEYEARIKRRKRLGADLGMAAAIGTGAGISIKGGGMAGKKLVPTLKSAPKVDKIINRASGGTITSAGVAGAGAGINNSMVTQTELKRSEGSRMDAYRVKRQLKSKTVSKSAAKNLEQNRQKRSQAYPKIAAAGAVAAGAGVAVPAGARKGLSALDNAKGKQSTKFADGVKIQEIGSARYNKSKASAPTPGRNYGGTPAQRNADSMDRGRKEIKTGLKQQVKAKRAKKVIGLGQKTLKPFAKPKTGIAMGALAGGLAATSAISHRNNKKGVTRPRHDWWQG